MKQRGSVLIYILIAIALLAALTMAFVEPSSQQGRTQNAYKLVQELRAQAETYRSAIQDCVLTYPAGDTAGTPPLYAGYNSPYPVTPSSTYLPVGLRDATQNANSIRCPGNPGNSNSHAAIFGGTTGRFGPTPPALFGIWIYQNDSNGVFLQIATNKTDAYLADAVQKAAAMYGTCEAEANHSTYCPVTDNCLLVWIIRNTACP